MGLVRRIRRRSTAFVGGAAVLAGLTAAPAHAATATAAAPDVIFAEPVAISPDGTVLGVFTLKGGNTLGGVWSPTGKLTYLTKPAGVQSVNVFSINARDEIAGVLLYAGGKSSAALWSRTGKVTVLPGADQSIAQGVNNCGEAAGGDGDFTTSWPATWSRSGVETKLALPAGGTFGQATVVNDSGVVGGQVYVTGLAYEPTLWRPDGQVVSLQTPGEFNSGAVNGINASGVTVGNVAVDLPTAPEDPVRWAPDGTATLLGGGEGDAFAVNDEGVAVGNLSGDDGLYGAVAWGLDAVPTVLPVPAGTLSGETNAFGINDAGDIVGTAEDTNSDTIVVEWTASGKILELATYPPLS